MPTIGPILMRWILVPVVAALLLSACSGPTGQSDIRTKARERASQLAIGTLNLEGTDQAVDAAVATQLLPLWELLSDLDTSSNAAPQELAATVEAIEAAMTPDQLAAIDVMDLSAAKVASSGQAPAAPSEAASRGATAQVAAQRAAGSSTVLEMDPGLGGEQGAAMGADMPMDGGMPPGGSSQTQASTMTGGNLSSGMYRDVIAMLQSRAQG